MTDERRASDVKMTRCGRLRVANGDPISVSFGEFQPGKTRTG
jgi:hypothetical protein